jgi:tetratricopeptide (TPR) repeat protein
MTSKTAATLHAAVVDEGGADVDPQAFVAAARSALNLGRHEDAVALARAGIAVAPTSAPAWTVLGDALWSAGDAFAARTAWEEALSIDDRDLGTALSCARAQWRTGDVAGARALVTFVLTHAHSDALQRPALALLAELDAAELDAAEHRTPR